MTDKKIVKKLEKLAYKLDSKNEWDRSSYISTCFYEIAQNFSKIVNGEEYALDAGKYLSLQNASERVDHYVNEILTKPELSKFAKKYGKFLRAVLERKNEIIREIEIRKFEGKTFAIGLAKSLLNLIKEEQKQIRPDYERMENAIRNRSISANNFHIESDDYLVVQHKKSAEAMESQISQLDTVEEYKKELKSIKKEASKVCKEIAAAVKECYITLNAIDSAYITENAYAEATTTATKDSTEKEDFDELEDEERIENIEKF